MQEVLTYLVILLGAVVWALWVYAGGRDEAVTAANKRIASLQAAASQQIAALNSTLSQTKANLTAEVEKTKETLGADLRRANEALADTRSQLQGAKHELQRLRADIELAIGGIRSDGVLLPSLVKWADELQRFADEGIAAYLQTPPRPAPKAADYVRHSRAAAREATKRARLFENRVALYEALAPWLLEHTDCTVEELLAGLREEAALGEAQESGKDPTSTFLTPAEWKELGEDERNQLALDRYWLPARRRSPWTAGIEYERFVGYSYEQAGFAVTYHGATLKKDDLGIDLVCKKGGKTHLVQCKRLSVQKGLPVRENVIAQTYGAAMFFALRAGMARESVVPAIVTTFELSETARKFADHLGVSVRERFAFAPYPCIKCNITGSGERIYHLPFDQQYDATLIDRPGEFYAASVAEARKRGFRRAFRWRGEAG